MGVGPAPASHLPEQRHQRQEQQGAGKDAAHDHASGHSGLLVGLGDGEGDLPAGTPGEGVSRRGSHGDGLLGHALTPRVASSGTGGRPAPGAWPSSRLAVAPPEETLPPRPASSLPHRVGWPLAMSPLTPRPPGSPGRGPVLRGRTVSSPGGRARSCSGRGSQASSPTPAPHKQTAETRLGSGLLSCWPRRPPGQLMGGYHGDPHSGSGRPS